MLNALMTLAGIGVLLAIGFVVRVRWVWFNEYLDRMEGRSIGRKLSPAKANHKWTPNNRSEFMETQLETENEELISLIRSVVTIELAKIECPECKARTEA